MDLSRPWWVCEARNAIVVVGEGVNQREAMPGMMIGRLKRGFRVLAWLRFLATPSQSTFLHLTSHVTLKGS